MVQEIDIVLLNMERKREKLAKYRNQVLYCVRINCVLSLKLTSKRPYYHGRVSVLHEDMQELHRKENLIYF